MSTIISVTNPIYDDVYKLQAWEDNNRTLKLVQGEGVVIPNNTDPVTVSQIKAPRFQLRSEQGVIDLTSVTPGAIQWAVKRPRGGEDLLVCNIVAGQATNGIIEIPITTSVTEYSGDAVGEIRLLSESGIVKFFGVNACISPGVSNHAAAQSSQYDSLIDALQQVVMLNNNTDRIAKMDDLVNGELPNGTNPVASGNLKTFLNNHFTKYSTISRAELSDDNTHLDPQTIYRYGNQGIILAANTDNKEAQFYFVEDGTIRYRHRNKTENGWDHWDFWFLKMEAQENKTTVINSSSTDTQYPTAKAVYDSLEAVYDNTLIYKYAVPNDTQTLPDNSVKLNDAIDPKVVYRYYSGGMLQGLIIPAVSSNQQTQYYLAQDGKMRYRYRKKTNGTWEEWAASDQFKIMINQDNLGDNLNPYLSPQNKLDKYFVKTCIDKSKVKLSRTTQILGFGDSIMATSDGGSWLEIVQNRIGCPAPINMAVGGAQFYIASSSKLLSTQLTNFFTRVDNGQIDASTIDLVIIAAGTNDAYNGTLINNFQLAVQSFFTNLQTGFTSRQLSCPAVLVITPIRRGKESEINAVDNNLELKIAKYSAVLNNLALEKEFSVLNGFDIPVLVDNMTITGVSSETATITSLMLTSQNGGSATDDRLHVHPNSTSGRATYAQAVINAIGFDPLVDTANCELLSNKSDDFDANLTPTAAERQKYPTVARLKEFIGGNYYDIDEINAMIGTIPAIDAYTKSETNALLSSKAPVINVETDPVYDSDLSELLEQSTDGTVTVNAQQGTLGYADLILSEGESLLPDTFSSVTNTGEVNGVTVEFVNGNSIRLNGTCTGNFFISYKNTSTSFSMKKAMSAGDSITVGVVCSGSYSGTSSYYTFAFRNGTNQTSKTIYRASEGVTKDSVTLNYDSSVMTLDLKVTSGTVYTNYLITPFAFVGTDVDSVHNPGYVSGEADISTTVADYDYLSTFPNKHTVAYKADTKAYIDNKEIDPVEVAAIADQQITAAMPTINSTINTNVNTAVNAKVTYITPEQYGAAGDGTTDDTTALQNCLNAAGSTKFIKALKYYKITSPVRISSDECYVEINRIKYTGNDFAVKIAARNSNIKIKQIEASAGGGVLIKNDNGSGQVTSNSFEFNFISTNADCIKFEATVYYSIAYNNFKVPYLKSTNGNLINLNGSTLENVFHGGKIDCDNGWCIYNTNAHATNTFVRFSFEKTSHICYGAARIVDCRTGEALNEKGDKPEGVFMKITQPNIFIVKELADSNTCVTYTGVDVSEKESFAELMAKINDKIAAQDPDDPLKYFIACYDIINYGEYVISNISRYRASGMSETLDGKMVIYWNKKAYVPNNDVLEDITTTPFVPLDTVKNNPTYFRIGVANCVINLNDSYCPVGIDSFIVEQTNDYKATIYNKDNTLVFDGANLPAGKYKVSCYVTPLSGTVFDNVNMPAYDRSYYATRIRYLYTGSNEEWVVTSL